MLSNRCSLPCVVVAVLLLPLAALACNAGAATPPTPSPTLPKPDTELVTPLASAQPAPIAVTNVETNLRAGPGLDYDILATLSAGLTVRLTGRVTDKTWWQIEFPASPDGRAWVYAANVTLSQGVNPDALPIAAAPPAPTRAPTVSPTNTPPVTPTPRPPAATNTPAAPPTPRPPAATNTPAAPPIFRADKTQLKAGECTLLRWDVDNVKALFLDAGSGDEPVVGHDTRRVCLDASATFTLHVIHNDDTFKKYPLTITVSGECGNTPTIIRFEASATQIKAGQSATLFWDVLCAQAVFFKEGTGGREPVVGHDERTVTPTHTTVYRLIVVAKDGRELKEDLEITVVP